MKVLVIEGRVDAVKGKYARIYVGGEEGHLQLLQNLLGVAAPGDGLKEPFPGLGEARPKPVKKAHQRKFTPKARRKPLGKSAKP